jgi:hypothetical protein
VRILTFRQARAAIITVLISGSAFITPAYSAETEWERLGKEILVQPPLMAEPGFQVKLVVPPGELYDPLYIIPRGEGAWVSDDGGASPTGSLTGGQLVEVSATGEVKVLVKRGDVHPPVGIDIAPKSFGQYAGQIYMSGETRPNAKNNVIQRIDPTRGFQVSDVCVLPDPPNPIGIAKGAFEARFGPDNGPFAGRFFVTTVSNSTIYQVTPDGVCTPFITFDNKTVAGKKVSGGVSLIFTPDGKWMLVSVRVPPESGKSGAIVKVGPDGKLEDKFVVETEGGIRAFTYAPQSFGQYGGQLFFTTSTQQPPPPPPEPARVGPSPGRLSLTEGPLLVRGRPATASLARIAPDGTVHTVVSGFTSPYGLHFFKDKLWVTDTASDFWNGERRQLPEGFIAEVKVQ